jgi:hypothetical protein
MSKRQEVAQALDIEDTAARGLHIEMPDLEGGKLLEADPAKCVLYFESLCSLFKLVVNTGDDPKLSLALAEWPSLPSSADTIKIGRVRKGIIMGQGYSAKNKAKIPRHESIPLLNRISKYSEGGWKKACCLEAHDKLKPPQALRNDSGFIMPYRLEHYLGQKQVLSEDVERALKDRDRHAKLPLHQLMTAAIDEAIARPRRVAADVARREQADGPDSDLSMDGDSAASGLSSAASSNMPPPSSRGTSSNLSASSDLTSAFSRDGTRAEEREQLKNVEYMPFGVFQRKVTMHQVLNNATEVIRGWTPASEEERRGMSPLMSLGGDGARFFHVISSKTVGGHATGADGWQG